MGFVYTDVCSSILLISTALQILLLNVYHNVLILLVIDIEVCFASTIWHNYSYLCFLGTYRRVPFPLVWYLKWTVGIVWSFCYTLKKRFSNLDQVLLFLFMPLISFCVCVPLISFFVCVCVYYRWGYYWDLIYIYFFDLCCPFSIYQVPVNFWFFYWFYFVPLCYLSISLTKLPYLRIAS